MLELLEDRSTTRRRFLTTGIAIGAVTTAAATAAVLWANRKLKRRRAEETQVPLPRR